MNEDVIKALECCNTKGNCNQCPYEIVGEYTPCYSALTQDALALFREKDETIKALDALIALKDSVIEKYEAYIGNLNDDKACLVEQIEKKDAEIERLNKAMDVMVLEHKRLIEMERRKNKNA
jgi:hypothetical protein